MAREKLGNIRLNDNERRAIAAMVESPGYKVWKNKILAARELQISGSLINTGATSEDLWLHKGMSYENANTPKLLEGIAKDVEAKEDQEQV
jgi:hypothetical protein